MHWNHDWVAGTPFDKVRHVVLFDFAPVSVTQMVIAEDPAWPPALTVTVRLAPLPFSAMLAAEITPGFEEVAWTVKLVAGSSASSTVNESGPVD